MKKFLLARYWMTATTGIGLAIASSMGTAAKAASLSFSVSSPISSDSTPAIVDLFLDDTGGSIKVDVKVADNSPNIADLRGVFFNVLDNSLLSGLSITGPRISQFATGSVSSLGQGNVITPGGPFEVGVEIGSAGLGKRGADDIRATTFTISHTSASLTVNQFARQNFGVRLTSVGTGTNREGSSKLQGTAPDLPSKPNKPTKVPEPGALGSFLLVGLGFMRLGKKQAAGNDQ